MPDKTEIFQVVYIEVQFETSVKRKQIYKLDINFIRLRLLRF